MPKKHLWTLCGTLAFLIALVALSISFYNWNLSVLFRTGQDYAEVHQFPKDMVLLEEGGYDGMLYYQIARDVPRLFGFGEETSIPYQSQYRYQRIGLPVFAAVFSLGNEQWLSTVFVLINIVAVMGSLFLMLSLAGNRILHALTIALNPAALVGILYNLTEPLSLFFVTLFFFLWEKSGGKIQWPHVIALTISVFARETTLILIVLIALYLFWKKRWKEGVFTSLSLAPFFLWQWILTMRFDMLPLENSAGALNFPLSGPLALAVWSIEDPSMFRLSALAFLLLFVLPLTMYELKVWFGKNAERSFHLFLLTGLTTAMLSMDAHIWGVVTSIGRVIAPIYGAYAAFAIQHDTAMEKVLSVALISVSIVAAIGIAYTHHPFLLS
jgi:hypothetical protein